MTPDNPNFLRQILARVTAMNVKKKTNDRRVSNAEGMIAEGDSVAYRVPILREERTRHNRCCSLPTVTAKEGRHFRRKTVHPVLPRATFVLFGTSVFILTPVETT